MPATTIRIALIGDPSPTVPAHRAIPLALAYAGRGLGVEVTPVWIGTRELGGTGRDVDGFAGIWIVPASPYENTAGVLRVIRRAREQRQPVLGTCGGFQHMLIELARDVAGLTDADHGETNPTGRVLVVAPLACSLVEQSGRVHFAPGSELRRIYGTDSAVEGYRCRYGLNPAYRAELEGTGLRFTATDDDGELRGAELPVNLHPFFCGTLFQPERAALRDQCPPLAHAFVAAAIRHPSAA